MIGANSGIFSILTKVARNLFACNVEDVLELIQVEFIQLINDSFAKDEFHSYNLSFGFKCNVIFHDLVFKL